MVAVHYDGGITQGEKFVDCVGPGQKQVDDGGDHYYKYPLNQRNWVNDDVDNADDGLITFFSSDGQMSATVITNFILNTSCEPKTVDGKEYKGGTLQIFHEYIGKPRKAYFDDNEYGAGWEWVLKNYIGRPLQQAFNTYGKSYGTEELWRDPTKRNELQAEIEQALPDLINRQMETDEQFFMNLTVSIDEIEPPAETKALIQQRQDAKIKAETAEANKQAEVAAAEAQAAIEKAKAQALKAEIEGYGGVQWYACLKSIEAGMPCFQPNGQLVINPKK